MMQDHMRTGVGRPVLAEIVILLAVATFFPAFLFLLNFGRPHLMVTVTAPAEGTATLLLSAGDGRGGIPVSLGIRKGYNWLDFPLPLFKGAPARLIMGPSDGTYQVTDIEWDWMGFRRVLSVRDMGGIVDDPTMSVTLVEKPWPKVVIEATGAPPSLILPAGKPGSVVWLTIFLVPSALLLLWLPRVWGAFANRRFDRICSETAMASVALSFGVLFLAAWRYPRKWPYFDDWRYVLPGVFDLTGSNFKWVFRAGNDTFFLTGQIIDWLVLHATNFDFGLSRMFALLFFGSFLVATSLLMRAAFRDAPIQASYSILLLTACIVGDAYWGSVLIAYHQFLPILFASFLLLVIQGDMTDSLRRITWRSIMVAVLSVFCGLAYASGALMLLCFGLAYGVVYHSDLRTRGGWRRHLPGLGFLLWGALTFALQVILITKAQGSLTERNSAVESVYPTEARFWLYFIGLFGKACGYMGLRWTIDLLITLLLLLPTVVFVTRCLSRRTRTDPSWEKLTFLAVSSGLTVIAYAAIVTFARAGFAQAAAPAGKITATAKWRFHYFWIAALLPHLWCGWYLLLGMRRRCSTLAALLLVAVWLVMLAPKSDRPWRYCHFHKKQMAIERRGVECVWSHIIGEEAKKPMTCADIFPGDLTPALENLHEKGITLGGQFPGVLAGISR